MTSGSCGGELGLEKLAELEATYVQAPLKMKRDKEHQEQGETDETDDLGCMNNGRGEVKSKCNARIRCGGGMSVGDLELAISSPRIIPLQGCGR